MTSENELQRAALIGRIAAGLAHDINGPVGVIIGFADLARESLRGAGDGRIDPESARRVLEYVDMISDAAVRARTLTRGVWVFARTQPGVVGAVDVTRTVRLSAALAMPELRGARIETPATDNDLAAAEPGAPPLGPLAHADLALCAQGFVSLFLAAPIALPSGGSISWDVRVTGGDVRIELTGRPYDAQGKVQDWPATEMARAAFEKQGGRLHEPGGPSVVGVLPARASAADASASSNVSTAPASAAPSVAAAHAAAASARVGDGKDRAKPAVRRSRG